MRCGSAVIVCGGLCQRWSAERRRQGSDGDGSMVDKVQFEVFTCISF
jgi:hypothetical protein